MAAQEGEAGVARGLLEGLGRVMGRGVALGLGGQAGELLPGAAPIGGEAGHIGREVAAGRDRRRNHRIHAVVPALENVGAGDGI